MMAGDIQQAGIEVLLWQKLIKLNTIKGFGISSLVTSMYITGYQLGYHISL